MTATITHDPPSTGADHPSRAGYGWARAGALSGVLAAITFFAFGMLPVEEADLIDNSRVLDVVADSEVQIWLFQAGASAVALTLLVFGAGLRRRLAGRVPADSLLPTLALAGVVITATLTLAGAGMSTELFWNLVHDTEMDPDTISAQLVVFNTIAWVWAALGLTAGAVAVAASRYGAVPRWIGRVSVGAAALIGLLQLVPLQYLSVVPGLLWLITAGIGIARAERTESALRTTSC